MRWKAVRWWMSCGCLLAGQWLIAPAAEPVTAGGLLTAQGTISAVDMGAKAFSLTPPGSGAGASPLTFYVDPDAVIVKNREARPWRDLLASSDPVSVRYVMQGTRRLVQWMYIGPLESKRIIGTVADVDGPGRQLAIRSAAAPAGSSPSQVAVSDHTLIVNEGERERLQDLQRGQLVTVECAQQAGETLAEVIEVHEARDWAAVKEVKG